MPSDVGAGEAELIERRGEAGLLDTGSAAPIGLKPVVEEERRSRRRMSTTSRSTSSSGAKPSSRSETDWFRLSDGLQVRIDCQAACAVERHVHAQDVWRRPGTSPETSGKLALARGRGRRTPPAPSPGASANMSIAVTARPRINTIGLARKAGQRFHLDCSSRCHGPPGPPCLCKRGTALCECERIRARLPGCKTRDTFHPAHPTGGEFPARVDKRGTVEETADMGVRCIVHAARRRLVTRARRWRGEHSALRRRVRHATGLTLPGAGRDRCARTRVRLPAPSTASATRSTASRRG